MYYCDECAGKRGWPLDDDSYVERCEVCGKTASCNDFPSSILPKHPHSPWSEEWPTTPGIYWFYGYLDSWNGRELVVAKMVSDCSFGYILPGKEIHRGGGIEGLWLPIEEPALPNVEAEKD